MRLGFGFGATFVRAQGSSVDPVPASLIQGANTIGNLFGVSAPLADTNYPGVVAGLTRLPLPTNGWVMRVDLSAAVLAVDPTKLRVNFRRPKFNSIGVLIPSSDPSAWPDFALGTGLLRQPTPNDQLDLKPATNSYYLTLDTQVMGSDTILSVEFLPGFYTTAEGGSPAVTLSSGVGRFDNALYPMPIVDCMELPYTARVATSNGSFSAEFTGAHYFARDGKPFACVKAWARNTDTGTDGPKNVSSNMSLSPQTPTNNPSGLRVASYQVTIDTTGLSDGNCEIQYIAYPQVGDVYFDSSRDGEAYPTHARVRGVPFTKDVAGRYSPIYAFVNYDGTGLLGTDTSGIQTDMIDLAAGADTHAKSYQNVAEAAKAAAAWNNDTSKRGAGKTHNDSAGLVVVLRPVSTSTTIGTNDGVYSGRAANSISPGPLALEVRSLSGLPTNSVRFRSVNYDGTGGGSGVNTTFAQRKWAISKLLLRGITFDTMGLEAIPNDNMILNFQGNAFTDTTAPTFITVDCRTRAGGIAPGTYAMFYYAGLRHDIRLDAYQDNQYLGNSNGSLHRLAIGCLFDAMPVHPNTMLACWARYLNSPVLGEPGNVPMPMKPFRSKQQKLWMSVRADSSGGTSTHTQFRNPYVGVAMVNALLRKYAFTASNGVAFYNDQCLTDCPNGVFQNITFDCGDDTSNPGKLYSYMRVNFDYCDFAFAGLGMTRNMTLSASAIPEYNSKDDTHTLAYTVTAPAVVANTTYWPGDMVKDANTPANFYWCIKEATTGSSPSSDVADTSNWYPLGQINGQTFSTHPFRTANWKGQWNVDRMFNAISRDNNNVRRTQRGSFWLGEQPGRGTLYDASVPDFHVRRTGGLLGTGFSDWGDYTPKTGSPLNGLVPAGRQFTSHDMLGNARNNLSGGAAGCIETGNTIVHGASL